MRYAEILLPLPLANTFTYRIPEAMTHLINRYCRVVAPFGKKLFYTGIVIDIHERCPAQTYEVKELFALLDENPVIRDSQLSFWRWISSYYMCSLGEVCRAALPSGLKNENESLKEGFKPKTETILRLSDHIQTEADLHHELNLIKRAKRQEKLLFDFLELSGISTAFSELQTKTVFKKALLKYGDTGASVLNSLLQRNILVAEEQTVSRIDLTASELQEETVLSEAQRQAFREIKESFGTKEITLLHGVISSGKTEIYIRLIQEALSNDMQVLYLLPEIALTMQVTERLRRFFGNRLFVYNSGLSDNERVEIWNHLLRSDEPLVVLGARSAVFLPFARLGLVIIDEEQDSSYKQQDPAPRYHARNTAMILASRFHAKTLLGSATPSLESYLWAKNGKYGYVTLNDRYGGSLPPIIEVVNVRELRRKRRMKETLFSPLLKEKMDEALSKGEQVILFQNRRGFAPFITCHNCGKIPHCANCDVCLTYHKQIHRLACHYCGYSIPLPSRCPSCDSEELKLQGFGTEKVEEEVGALFPTAVVARLDWDTARTGNACRRILSDFETGKTQILIGTQMISKGLDFANVHVVGILSADGMMNIPDFRAYERAFQMMLQVSGRAGRRDRQGWVVIQTAQNDNTLLQKIQQFDYLGMAKIQLEERHQFHYPPYTRLIMIVLRSRNEKVLDQMAEIYAEKLKSHLGQSVSGPVCPPVARVQALFVRKIMLKTELSLSVSDARKILENVHTEMQQIPLFRQIILHYDVDPQ